jgi:hypothetical protein
MLTERHHATLRRRFGDAYLAHTVHSMARDGGAEVHALLGLDVAEMRENVPRIGASLSEIAAETINEFVLFVAKHLHMGMFVSAAGLDGLVDAVLGFKAIHTSFSDASIGAETDVHPILEVISIVYNFLARTFGGAIAALTPIVESLREMFHTTIDKLSGVTASIADLIKAGAERVFRAAVSVFALLVDALHSLVASVISLVSELPEALMRMARAAGSVHLADITRSAFKIGYFTHIIADISSRDLQKRRADLSERLHLAKLASLVQSEIGALLRVAAPILEASDAAIAWLVESRVGKLLVRYAGLARLGAAVTAGAALAWFGGVAAVVLVAAKAAPLALLWLVRTIGTHVAHRLWGILGACAVSSSSLLGDVGTRAEIDEGRRYVAEARARKISSRAIERIAEAVRRCDALEASVNASITRLKEGPPERRISYAWRASSLLASLTIKAPLSAEDAALYHNMFDGRSFEAIEAEFRVHTTELLEGFLDFNDECAAEIAAAPKIGEDTADYANTNTGLRRRRADADPASAAVSIMPAPAFLEVVDENDEALNEETERRDALAAKTRSQIAGGVAAVVGWIAAARKSARIVAGGEALLVSFATSSPLGILNAGAIAVLWNRESKINKNLSQLWAPHIARQVAVAIFFIGVPAGAIYFFAATQSEAAFTRVNDELKKVTRANPTIDSLYEVTKIPRLPQDFEPENHATAAQRLLFALHTNLKALRTNSSTGRAAAVDSIVSRGLLSDGGGGGGGGGGSAVARTSAGALRAGTRSRYETFSMAIQKFCPPNETACMAIATDMATVPELAYIDAVGQMLIDQHGDAFRKYDGARKSGKEMPNDPITGAFNGIFAALTVITSEIYINGDPEIRAALIENNFNAIDGILHNFFSVPSITAALKQITASADKATLDNAAFGFFEQFWNSLSMFVGPAVVNPYVDITKYRERNSIGKIAADFWDAATLQSPFGIYDLKKKAFYYIGAPGVAFMVLASAGGLAGLFVGSAAVNLWYREAPDVAKPAPGTKPAVAVPTETLFDVARHTLNDFVYYTAGAIVDIGIVISAVRTLALLGVTHPAGVFLRSALEHGVEGAATEHVVRTFAGKVLDPADRARARIGTDSAALLAPPCAVCRGVARARCECCATALCSVQCQRAWHR